MVHPLALFRIIRNKRDQVNIDNGLHRDSLNHVNVECCSMYPSLKDNYYVNSNQ